MGVTARAAAMLVVAALVACAMRGGPPAAQGPSLVVVPAGTARPSTTLPVVFAEVAATQEARRRGLGGRAELPKDGGMLFVYATDDPRTFWMEDCLIALDIAFIDRDRRIVSVATLPPGAGLESSKIARAGSGTGARYVLETEAGWLARHGIRTGDEVDLAQAVAGVVPR
jgi:uncharacterized membrane protein (UPF0127 family)